MLGTIGQLASVLHSPILSPLKFSTKQYSVSQQHCLCQGVFICLFAVSLTCTALPECLLGSRSAFTGLSIERRCWEKARQANSTRVSFVLHSWRIACKVKIVFFWLLSINCIMYTMQLIYYIMQLQEVFVFHNVLCHKNGHINFLILPCTYQSCICLCFLLCQVEQSCNVYHYTSTHVFTYCAVLCFMVWLISLSTWPGSILFLLNHAYK